MRLMLRLLLIAAEATFLVAVGCFGAVLLTAKLFPQANGPAIAQKSMICLAFMIFLGVATWAAFRQLRAYYSRREARALTTAVAVFIPLSIAISMPLIPFFAIQKNIYELFASLIFASGAMTTVVTYGACAVVLWITRRIERVEQTH